LDKVFRAFNPKSNFKVYYPDKLDKNKLKRESKMRFFILGATGNTGKEIMDLALKQGHQVTAFARSPEKITLMDKGLTVIQGSPDDIEGMSKAMNGQDAVFSALGPKPSEIFTDLKKRSWTMEKYTTHILLAMEKAKVKKLVIYSSAGLFPGQNLFVKFLSALAHNHMTDLKGMEKVVTESPLDWTIARPFYLVKGADEQYRAQKGAIPPGALKMTFRALAKFMLDTAEVGLYQKQIFGLAK
jgi:putative NADH-flavin reductase